MTFRLWRCFSLATIGLDGFAMVFGLATIGLDGFSMVADHWSNDGMVTIHRSGLISTNCLTVSSQINQINQLKILNGLPSILSVSESHRANIMFTQAILIGSSRGVNLSPDPFLVGCMAAFSKDHPDLIQMFLTRHFLYSPAQHLPPGCGQYSPPGRHCL